MHDEPAKKVGLFGATSFVGECLLKLLKQNHYHVTAFSRQTIEQDCNQVTWQRFDDNQHTNVKPEQITSWICIAPIWTLPEHFNRLLAHNAKRIIVLSSTSRFTKNSSSDPSEQAMALRLKEYESRVRKWAIANGISWVILRPTLIYGLGRDKNVSEMIRFIRRFRFFPLFGSAAGLRQPIHAEDVATTCLVALSFSNINNKAYNLSGGETLSYREMVKRIFAALHRTPHLITVPRWVFKLAIHCVCKLPRYRHWTTAMAERMNTDLVFDCSNAMQDLNFSPRMFKLEPNDIPSKT